MRGLGSCFLPFFNATILHILNVFSRKNPYTNYQWQSNKWSQVSSPPRWHAHRKYVPWLHVCYDIMMPQMTQMQWEICLFIVRRQLSIHQRQRHSVALVTAYGPTPSYDMIREDLIGQMCVIISEMRQCAKVFPMNSHFWWRTCSLLWRWAIKEN